MLIVWSPFTFSFYSLSLAIHPYVPSVLKGHLDCI